MNPGGAAPSSTQRTGSFLAGAVLLTSALVPPSRLPGLPLCPMKALLGLPCPGCGMTHAFCALGHGDLGAAWQFNPWSLPLYGMTGLVLILPLMTRRYPRQVSSFLSRRWLPLTIPLLGLGMWAWNLNRWAAP